MTAEEAVNTVLEDSNWPDTSRNKILRWLFECNQDLKTPVWMEKVTSGVGKEKKLIVKDGYVEKPCNLVRVDDIRFYVEGTCYRPYFEPFEHRLNHNYSIFSVYNGLNEQGFTYTIQVHEEREGFRVTNAEGYEMVLTYGRFALDDDGLPIFDRDAMQAYKAWCVWQAYKMERNSMNNRVGQGQVQAAGQEYGFEKRRYQGIVMDRSISKDEYLQLSANMRNPFYTSNNPWRVLGNHSTYAQIFDPFYR